MSLRQVRYFVAVAKAGSFTGAARLLHVSQPALTLQIRQLEQRLDATLLRRHARGAELTAAGVAYLEHAELALESLNRAEHAVSASRALLPARVSLGLTPTAARELIPELLELCVGRETQLVLREGFTDDLWRAFSSGELDAVCCYAPDGAVCGSQANAEIVPLYREDFVLVGPSSLIQESDEEVSAAELASYPLVLGLRDHTTRRFIERVARESEVCLDRVTEVEAGTVKREMLIHRGRCSIVPYGLFQEDIKAGRLNARRTTPSFSRVMGLVTRPSESSVVQRFVLALLRPLVASRIAAERLRWQPVPQPSH